MSSFDINKVLWEDNITTCTYIRICDTCCRVRMRVKNLIVCLQNI